VVTRQLGSQGPELSVLGFGTWVTGGPWRFGWGPIDDDESIDAMRHAIEGGVNWIDTAAVYGLGHAETVVGRAVEPYRVGEEVFVFTKCGRRWEEQAEVTGPYYDLRPESIREECEASLLRLGVERIDLYQFHWPDIGTGTPVEESWGTMGELVDEGKVRWIGVSNFEVKQMRRAQSIAPITSLQPPYSLIRREIELEILPFCRREGLGVIVYSPMASGLLSGAMTRQRAAKLSADDWRHRDPEFNEPRLSDNLALVDRLRAIGARHGRSTGEVAIAWTLHHSAVTGAIVGARNSKQAEGVMRAADLRLSEEEVAEIESETPIAA
jgi:aryl-alcohol dehydrogenase-like predicted oxidoreductase